MDTVVRISIYPQGMSKKNMSAVMDKAFRMIEAMEIKTSAYIDTSEVKQIGAESGRNSVRVSPDVVQLLKNSISVSDQSGGAFDVTVGAIKKLWGFDSDVPHVLDRSLLSSMLPKVDYHQIHIEDDYVMLNREGMQIDLGGIAKGYIIDRAVDILRENGVRAAIVDGGGDLRIIGSHPSRETWRIGIRHPRSENGELYGVIE
ncbi:MAG: FAD:protein FMN transferase, partial [Thermoplasmata archaeon]|nr:FAD:protein FMN transferase [Thermoplasmata archaeon]